MMRRLAPLLLAGLVLAACGSAATEVASAPTEAPTTTDSSTTAAPAADVAPAEPVAETTTTTVAQLPTGREALEAAQAEGRPVVLWFWGAH